VSQRLINWALALTIVAMYAAMQTLDGPTDLQTEAAVAADVQDAIQTAQVTQGAHL